MKPMHYIAALISSASCAVFALASEAETSATAGSSRGYRSGTAAATARYEGDRGFARTDTRSGRVSLARGVALGMDEDGLSLSVSHAVAPAGGPAVASNFNISLGLDGSVAHSVGLAVADGPIFRSATAGGTSSAGRSGSVAASLASGKTDSLGTVRVTTHSDGSRPALPAIRRHIDARGGPAVRGYLLHPVRP